jgi:predicted transcriptional regulator
MKFIKSYENICCDDIIKCVFDLNILDLNVYKKLKEIGESRIEILAEKLKKDRSTIYRSLQRLSLCGLCIKKTNNIEIGGYYHTYLSVENNIAKKKIKSCIDSWYKSMKEIVELI